VTGACPHARPGPQMCPEAVRTASLWVTGLPLSRAAAPGELLRVLPIKGAQLDGGGVPTVQPLELVLERFDSGGPERVDDIEVKKGPLGRIGST
jgi:hypothetical protein